MGTMHLGNIEDQGSRVTTRVEDLSSTPGTEQTVFTYSVPADKTARIHQLKVNNRQPMRFKLIVGGTTVASGYTGAGVPNFECLFVPSEVAASGSTIELKATEYSRDVSDADFELPAEPQDMSALMAQYQ